MKRPELMAPAGSVAALRAALAAGADAVYLGGKQFNARQSAANFGDEELEAAIKLAHQSGAKVYVTVNTLLKAEEMPLAVKFLRQLYNMGADAAIVQDPGLIAAARGTTPLLELHASTQLTIHNVGGAKSMQQLGISRVVLARELSGDQIADIRQKTSIGLEVFVHGALCVAYSGQCLMSSLTGGRSGNRGQCAQPCRLPYQLTAGRASGHLLSPKDLCLYQQLPALMELGLDAWKIEGRLKRPSYVATVVRFYRMAIDRLAAGEQLPPWSLAVDELEQAFNRGFTSGYFLGKPGQQLLTTDQPGHRGAVVGRRIAGGQIALRQSVQIGDLLQGPNGQDIRISSIKQGPEQVALAEPGRPIFVPGMTGEVGSEVRRLQSAAQEAEAAELVEAYAPQPTPIRFLAQLRLGNPLRLQATAVGVVVSVEGTRPSESALSRPVDAELLSRQLLKTGDSGFVVEDLQVDIEPGLSIPLSEINHCRRSAISRLAEELWGQPRPLPAQTQLPQAPQFQLQAGGTRLAVAVADLSALAFALETAAQRIYFGAAFHLHARPALALADYALAKQLCDQSNVSCYLRLPRILLPEEEGAWVAALSLHQVEGLQVANWGGVQLARQLGLPYVLGTAMNVMNPHFITAAPDAQGFYLSPELNRRESLAILGIQGKRAYLEIHARHLLMVHEQCLLAANAGCLGAHQGCLRRDLLVDRKGYRFPLLGDATCRSYLYNSQAFSLIDQLPELLPKQLTGEMLIDLETETPERVAMILSCYQRAWQADGPEGLREQLEQLFPEGLTRGHWRRGV